MWNLQTPLLELIFRSAIIFAFLFVAMRLWGKKHFSELSPFDFLLLLIISEATQNALIDDDKSITGGITVIVTIFILNIVLNKMSFHSRKSEKLLEGKPKVLILDGKLDRDVMKEETMTEQELKTSLRKQGLMKMEDIGLAVIETNGEISVIKKEDTDFRNIPPS